LWYHDHTLGMTRLNVYAASAGFWLIRDENDGETGLISGVLPGPAPQIDKNPNCSRLEVTGRKGRNCMRERIREIPLAIQPKSFNADGSQYYPADRAFFEGLGTGGIFADNTDLNIPFLPQGTSDIAPVWNPEAFFNTMVVNGNTWPQLEVASERYRFRLLNAADSRFLNMALFVVNADGSLGEELPFYQIGSEQGLLPAVVRIETGFATTLPGNGCDVGDLNCDPDDATMPLMAVPGTFDEQALLMGPAERADVIVDFTGLPDGTVVRMINTAPDAPFGGFPDVPADPGTTGQVMQFVVDNTLNTPDGDPSSPAPDLVLDTNPGGVPKLGPSTATQDLALLEEESALLCVTVNAVTNAIELDPNSVPPTCDPDLGSVPFGPKAAVLGVNGSGGGEVQLWDDPIAQNPAVGATETWELWNWSADAHPIHLHLVKFEVVNREVISSGVVRDPEPWEAGWKDTVIGYPGEVTRVKALFDIPGLYVWHCHILSHEDNEMMVPYCVGKKGADCPAQLF
jgi:FtsP/CotA-like multicopper oxidase with cupredoxin domain